MKTPGLNTSPLELFTVWHIYLHYFQILTKCTDVCVAAHTVYPEMNKKSHALQRCQNVAT